MIYILKNTGKGKIGKWERKIAATDLFPVTDKKTEETVNSQEVRIGNLEGLQLIANHATQELSIKDASGKVISVLSVSFLNNEGTTFYFNELTKVLELRNDQGEVLTEVPASAFVSNLAKTIGLVGSTLNLKDTEGNILSSVQIAISNVEGLTTALSGKMDKGGNAIDTAKSLRDDLNAVSSAVSGISTLKVGIYGIEYDKTHAAPEVTRVGEMGLHASLPVQSKMRRCLLDDLGNVNYYLDANDSTLREDGTPAILDGSHGQVMVEIPRHWRKFEESGNIQRALISLSPFSGAHEVPKMYVSAYKAALDRVGNKLSSVVNATADYRGGNNQAEWDLLGSSQLKKPATVISRINFRAYAQNRGVEWFDMDYQVRKTIFWLITIEFANRHHQSAINPALTAEGYRQGGLGTGPTDISGADWNTFNGYYPLFDCGLTNSLGNNTGEVPVVLQDFPTAGLTKNTQVFSYRGVENFFGDLWEWTNGANIKIEGGIGSSYIATGLKKSDDDYLGYSATGLLPAANGYISEIQFGENGDILPKSSVGGSSTTFFGDYFYLGADGLRGLLFGGYAAYGALAGSLYVATNDDPSLTLAHVGSRLCFFPR